MNTPQPKPGLPEFGGRPRVGPRALPILALLLAAGCGEGATSAEWTTTVDTLPNGAIHVLNVPPPNGVQPTWRIEEELRIGSVDEGGPATFARVKGIAVLDDGRIAVLDAGAHELRLFDPDGAHLATHGGEGSGPGELRGGYGLMLGPAGELWVPDHANGRISVYDPETGFDRSYRYPVRRYGFIWDGIIDRDGRILRPTITSGPEQANLLHVYDRDMNRVDSLPLPPDPEVDPKDPPGAFYWEAPGGLPRGYIGVPYFARAVRVMDPRGVIWSTARGDPAYRIVRWTPGGDTTLVLEARRPVVPVTSAERDSAIDRVRARLREQGAADADWSKIPSRKPAVTSMFVAEDGRLWVQTMSADTLTEYDVYERDGHHAGTAVTSLKVWGRVSPIVRDDRFWAVVTDELGVPYVVRGRITAASGTTEPG